MYYDENSQQWEPEFACSDEEAQIMIEGEAWEEEQAEAEYQQYLREQEAEKQL